MNSKTFRDLVKKGECETVEFKISFDKEAIETLAAFANTKGGTVLIGVQNSGELCDVQLGKETLQNWTNQISGTAQREDRWEYPLDALREIVVNMIVHRDYMSSNDAVIKIFDEHIEFFNPGSLPDGLTVDQLIRGDYSPSIRNKQIATVFKEAGIIEKYGSGIKRVLEAFNKYDLPQPIFEEIQSGFKVSVFKTTQKTTQKTQTRNQILALLSKNPKMTREDLARTLAKSPNTVKGHIAKLKSEGRIKRIGSDRNGYWEVILTD